MNALVYIWSWIWNYSGWVGGCLAGWYQSDNKANSVQLSWSWDWAWQKKEREKKAVNSGRLFPWQSTQATRTNYEYLYSQFNSLLWSKYWLLHLIIEQLQPVHKLDNISSWLLIKDLHICKYWYNLNMKIYDELKQIIISPCIGLKASKFYIIIFC